MTNHQVTQARSDLPEKVPVLQMRVGIDTAFYRANSTFTDVPEEHRDIVEALLGEPYVILPGDELRLNDDALRIVRRTGLRLVRISQYRKGSNHLVRERVKALGLEERVAVFEKITYKFLRFLLRNAAAYAGVVDSTWQPAGWTVACESLASGLPLVLYDGLTPQELRYQGYDGALKVIEYRDISSFGDALIDATALRRDAHDGAAAFAEANLDCTVTAAAFGRTLMSALGLSG